MRYAAFALMLLLWGAVLAEVKAQEAAVLGYLEPVGAIILAFLIFNEVPSAIAILGGSLILIAGYIVTMKRI